MLKIRINQAKLLKNVICYIASEEKLTPVIEDNNDLSDWLTRIITDWCSGDIAARMTVQYDDETVIIGGNSDIIDAIQMGIMTAKTNVTEINSNFR